MSFFDGSGGTVGVPFTVVSGTTLTTVVPSGAAASTLSGWTTYSPGGYSGGPFFTVTGPPTTTTDPPPPTTTVPPPTTTVPPPTTTVAPPATTVAATTTTVVPAKAHKHKTVPPKHHVPPKVHKRAPPPKPHKQPPHKSPPVTTLPAPATTLPSLVVSSRSSGFPIWTVVILALLAVFVGWLWRRRRRRHSREPVPAGLRATAVADAITAPIPIVAYSAPATSFENVEAVEEVPPPAWTAPIEEVEEPATHHAEDDLDGVMREALEISDFGDEAVPFVNAPFHGPMSVASETEELPTPTPRWTLPLDDDEDDPIPTEWLGPLASRHADGNGNGNGDGNGNGHAVVEPSAANLGGR